jgi:hypothetical protein
MALSLRLRLKFHSFFNDALLPNFEKIVEREFLIIGPQQLEDIFSITSHIPIGTLAFKCCVWWQRT